MSVQENYDPIVVSGRHKLCISYLDADIDLDLHDFGEERVIVKMTSKTKKVYHAWIANEYKLLRKNAGCKYEDGMTSMNYRIIDVIKKGLADERLSDIKKVPDEDVRIWKDLVRLSVTRCRGFSLWLWLPKVQVSLQTVSNGYKDREPEESSWRSYVRSDGN